MCHHVCNVEYDGVRQAWVKVCQVCGADVYKSKDFNPADFGWQLCHSCENEKNDELPMENLWREVDATTRECKLCGFRVFLEDNEVKE